MGLYCLPSFGFSISLTASGQPYSSFTATGRYLCARSFIYKLSDNSGYGVGLHSVGANRQAEIQNDDLTGGNKLYPFP